MNNRSLITLEKKRACGASALLELLAGVAIVALLAALVIPAVRGMTEKGKTMQRMANLKAIAHACQVYAADNDGSLPFLCSSAAGGWAKPFWYNTISPYLPQKQAQVVGSGQVKSLNYSALVCPFVPSGQHGGSDYAGSSGVFFAPGESPSGSAMRVAAIENPSQVVLAVSAEVRSSGLPSWYVNARYYANFPDSSSNLPSAKWTRSPNIAAVFVDGHYEEISPAKFRENRATYMIPKNLLQAGWLTQ